MGQYIYIGSNGNRVADKQTGKQVAGRYRYLSRYVHRLVDVVSKRHIDLKQAHRSTQRQTGGWTE